MADEYALIHSDLLIFVQFLQIQYEFVILHCVVNDSIEDSIDEDEN